MEELERLIIKYKNDIDSLNLYKNSIQNIPTLNLELDLLKQISIPIINILESFLPDLGLNEEKLKDIKDSISYYRFNIENGIDFSLLLKRDSKLNKFLSNIELLYQSLLNYSEEKLNEIKSQLLEKEAYKKELDKIKEMLLSNQVIDISNLSRLLQKLNLSDSLKIELLKKALQLNISLGVDNNLEDEVEQSLLNLLNKNLNKSSENDVDQNRVTYGVKPISDKKDEDLKNKIGVLLSDIDDLRDRMDSRIRYFPEEENSNIFVLQSELKELLINVSSLQEDFLNNYIIYKELATESEEKEELNQEYRDLLIKYYKSRNKFNDIKKRFNLEIKEKIEDINIEDQVESVKKQIEGWDRCRLFIIPNSVYSDFESTLERKTLKSSTILTFVDGFKDLLTVKDLMTLGKHKVDKMKWSDKIFKYRVTKGEDSGAVRIYFSYSGGDLVILKVLFKTGKNQEDEAERRIKKVNVDLVAEENKDTKEEMTDKIINLILTKYKNTLDITEEVGEDENDRRNTSKI